MDDKKTGKSNNKKNTGLIIAVAAAALIGLTSIIIVVVGIAKISSKEPETTEGSSVYVLSEVTAETAFTDAAQTETAAAPTETTAAEVPIATMSETQPTLPPTETLEEETVSPSLNVEKFETLTKTGDNILADTPDNEFIKIIMDKYSVPAEKLVAVYSVPDQGSNFVLEFSGKRDDNGNIIKSPKTLARLYMIDKDRNVKITTGKPVGNVGVSYAEGMMSFYMVTNIVMKQYPDYFTGV